MEEKTEVQAMPQDNIQCFLGAERLLNFYTDCTSISNIKSNTYHIHHRENAEHSI